MADGSISSGSATAINSNAGLLGPLIGGFSNTLGAITGGIGHLFGIHAVNTQTGNAGEQSLINAVGASAARGGKLDGACASFGCPQGALLPLLEPLLAPSSTLTFGPQRSLRL